MELHKQNILFAPSKVKGHFLLGSTITFLKNPVQFLKVIVQKYGTVAVVKFAGIKYYVFQHPDYIKYVMLDNQKHYIKPGATKLLSHFLGEGLSTSNGELWLKHRRLMQPAFHRQSLSNLVNIVHEETSEFIIRLEQISKRGIVNITHEMLQLTIAIISRTMFTVTIKDDMQKMLAALEELASFAASWIKQPIKIPLNWLTTNNKRYKSNCALFDEIVYHIIEDRKKEIKKNGTPVNNDLLDLLLTYFDADTKSPMTEKLLRDEVTTIFMAGHETTAQTLSWMLYHLAENKSIYQKLKNEASFVNANRFIQYDELPRLEYTLQVVKETLRLYPPIWALVREPIIDDKIKSLFLKAKSKVLLNIYGMHHHPNYWSTPDRFNPNHFEPAIEKLRPAFVFLPFGGGPRLCLGQNFAMMVMQIVISRISQEFEFEVPEGYTPEVEPNITLRAKGGIQLLVKNHSQYS